MTEYLIAGAVGGLLALCLYLYLKRDRARRIKEVQRQEAEADRAVQAILATLPRIPPDHTPLSAKPNLTPIRRTIPRQVPYLMPSATPVSPNNPFRDDDPTPTHVSGLGSVLVEAAAEALVEAAIETAVELKQEFQGEGGTFGGAGASGSWGGDPTPTPSDPTSDGT